jgi:hypothetical protein
MTSYTIHKAFRDRGILPYSPGLVIDRLVRKQTPEPDLQIFDSTPPPEQVSSILNTPPKSINKARRQSNKMCNLLTKLPIADDIRI